MHIPSPTLHFHLWSCLSFLLSSDGLYSDSPGFFRVFSWSSCQGLYLTSPWICLTFSYFNYVYTANPSWMLFNSVPNLNSHTTTTTTHHPPASREMKCHRQNFNNNKNHPRQKVLIIDWVFNHFSLIHFMYRFFKIPYYFQFVVPILFRHHFTFIWTTNLRTVSRVSSKLFLN